MSYLALFFRDAVVLGLLATDNDSGPPSNAAAVERRASSLTSSENLSAPEASEAKASPAVLAATVPNAAASFKPEANAASAICSPALIASSEEIVRSLPELFRAERALLVVLLVRGREAFDNATVTSYNAYLRWESSGRFSASIK